jgi:hypothetical protein
MKAVIFLYASESDAEKGSSAGGSGFIVGVPTSVSADLAFLWAVTNEHVAYGGLPVIRTAGKGRERIEPRTPDDWITPYSGDDLAITPLGFAPDDRDYRLSYVPRDWFVTEDDFRQARTDGTEPRNQPFGPGDETVILGRLLAYPGEPTNRPVARFGNLAVGETLPVKNPRRAFWQESLLAEARSLSGYSGSPVFVYRPGNHFLGPYSQIDGRLVGVTWGHLTAKAEDLTGYEVTWDEPATVADREQRYHSGMTCVVPAWTLAQLLDSEEAISVQRRVEQRVKETDEYAAELDAPSSNPEFDRFDSLARRIVTAPKDQPQDESRQ